MKGNAKRRSALQKRAKLIFCYVPKGMGMEFDCMPVIFSNGQGYVIGKEPHAADQEYASVHPAPWS